MQITRTSILSGKTHTREIPCTPEQLNAWENGQGLIQVIMPNLSADDREFIMTGSTPEEWNSAFPDE